MPLPFFEFTIPGTDMIVNSEALSANPLFQMGLTLVLLFLSVLIVFFSIRWWRDQHPSAVVETGQMSRDMYTTWFTCVAVFLILLIYLLRRRYFLESARLELERLERTADLGR